MTITLYGIPNCDTVRKAKKWLEAADHDYQFHNFKRDGVPAEALSAWVAAHGLETVVNRRGTTWRKLDDAQKSTVDAGGDAALALIVAQASLIKRPILTVGKHVLIGFKADEWQAILV